MKFKLDPQTGNHTNNFANIEMLLIQCTCNKTITAELYYVRLCLKHVCALTDVELLFFDFDR